MYYPEEATPEPGRAMATPAAVRVIMLAAWLYAWSLGWRSLCSPLAGPGEAEAVVDHAMHAVVVLPAIYNFDSLLCLVGWTTMYSIPVNKVLQHHIPFAIAMLPPACLTLFFTDAFRAANLETPAVLTFTASGCLTSLNEAFWVLSGLFPESWLQQRWYRVLQPCFSIYALLEFLVLGLMSCAVVTYSLVPKIFGGASPYMYSSMLLPHVGFFAVAPLVQVPLLRNAVRRLRRSWNEGREP